jgi:hypothetical protein
MRRITSPSLIGELAHRAELITELIREFDRRVCSPSLIGRHCAEAGVRDLHD